MFSSLKVWLLVGTLALGGLGYVSHKFIVKQKQDQITELSNQIQELTKTNAILEITKQTQDDTIRQLQENIQKQIATVRELTVRSAAAEKERDAAIAIFNDHDFTKLARLKPGLIETRINNKTREVFNQIERESRTWQELDTQYAIPNSSSATFSD